MHCPRARARYHRHRSLVFVPWWRYFPRGCNGVGILRHDDDDPLPEGGRIDLRDDGHGKYLDIVTAKMQFES